MLVAYNRDKLLQYPDRNSIHPEPMLSCLDTATAESMHKSPVWKTITAYKFAFGTVEKV